MAVGCASPKTYDIGYRAPLHRLDQLVSGQTGASDVVAILGKPRGYGNARFNREQPLRDIMYYEYLRLKGDQASVNILLVFLKEDRFDGYLWFGAEELMQ